MRATSVSLPINLAQNRSRLSGSLVLGSKTIFYVKTLRRPPFPKPVRRLPLGSARGGVAYCLCREPDASRDDDPLCNRRRRAERCHRQVADIDSLRMIIHVRRGKGNRDRDLLLTPKPLETFGEEWRWTKPEAWLSRAGQQLARRRPITEKIVRSAVRSAEERAGIQKRVSPHTLRHMPPARLCRVYRKRSGGSQSGCFGWLRRPIKRRHSLNTSD